VFSVNLTGKALVPFARIKDAAISGPPSQADVLDFRRASENAVLESAARFRILAPLYGTQLSASQEILDLVMEPCIERLD
jgi:hypothetical protein